MLNSRHREAILSPSLSRITNRIRSSITELSFHGIPFFRAPFGGKSVTHVSGMFCYLCLGTVTRIYSILLINEVRIRAQFRAYCTESVRADERIRKGVAREPPRTYLKT